MGDVEPLGGCRCGNEDVRAAAFHQLSDMLVVTSGPQHLIVGANEAFGSVMGMDPVGQTISSLMVDSEAQGVIDLYEAALAGEAVDGEEWRFNVITAGRSAEVFADFKVVPMRNEAGAVIGTIGRAVDVTDRVLRQHAQEAEVAELARKYRRATDVVDELQRALLPASLPVAPGLALAASYVVAGEEMAAGGDWFDAIPCDGGHMALVVGDVLGHGVAAAATMAQVRAVTHDRLVAGESIESAVRSLERFAGQIPAVVGTTICIVALDTASGQFEYSTLGHPPPLIVDVSGESAYLPPTGHSPLGMGSSRHPNGRGHLGEGQILLLYSDGIVERPGVDPAVATIELARNATNAATDRLLPINSPKQRVDRVARQTIEALTRTTGRADDITLLAAELTPVLEPLELDFPVGPGAAGIARDAFEAWLGVEHVAPTVLAELGQVLTELVDNAARHAYVNEGGPVMLTAGIDRLGVLSLTVSDRGAWKSPRATAAGTGGIGLALTRRFVESLEVDGDDSGTTAVVRYRLWRPVHIGASGPWVRPMTKIFDVAYSVGEEEAVLRVAGPVDAASLDELNQELALSVRKGSPRLTIDLDDVVVLASVGIHAIWRALDEAKVAGVQVVVRARPSTPASQALALAGIAFHHANYEVA